MKQIIYFIIAVIIMWLMLSLLKSNRASSTSLDLSQRNAHIHDYKNRYYEVFCYVHQAVVLHDWSENDLNVYEDKRIEYLSATKNRVITLYNVSLCASIPPVKNKVVQKGG